MAMAMAMAMAMRSEMAIGDGIRVGMPLIDSLIMEAEIVMALTMTLALRHSHFLCIDTI